ncbi:MAG: hypothetical protein LBF74_11515 [Treponema sp.]|jgi:ABC-type glycerol-3-phosphate transport system permease component|nr:hypothetical protein [Treponema sp.]
MFGPKIKLERSDMVIRGVTYVLISAMALAALIPFALILASSFSSEDAIRLSGFTIWPKEFSTYAYELLFRSPKQIGGAYVLTISLTCIGTGFGLFIIAMTGYALQRRDFPFRNIITFLHLFYITFFGGTGSFLYDHDPDIQTKRQLFGDFASPDDESLADYSDAEFCQGGSP